MPLPFQTWGTAEELKFIDHLGEFTLRSTPPSNRTRLHLTEQYVKSLSQRKAWGDLDYTKVLFHAQKRCAQIQAHIKAYPQIP